MMKSGHTPSGSLLVAVVIALVVTGCVVETSSAQPATARTVAMIPTTSTISSTPAPVAQPLEAQGLEVQPSNGDVQMIAGLESSAVLRNSGGQAFMVIDLCATNVPLATARTSMAVALVIDRSGSMAGDKIINARAAATALIQNMADGDVVAIYAYDDVVDQLAPPTVVTETSRAALMMAVQRLYARGSTNLHGGLVTGFGALSGPAAERPVRRVVLISDGQANVGPSTPSEVGQAAATAAASGISTTAIGVGLDYNEALLDAVAIRSGGRFYHLMEPAQLAGILRTELNALEATVARNVILELTPAPGVQILGASGADLTRSGASAFLNVGDLLSQQSRQIVIPLNIPTSGPAQQSAAQVTLNYRRAETDEGLTSTNQVVYTLATSTAEVSSRVRPELAVAVEQYRASQAQLEAARLVGQGQNARAADVLEAQARSSEQRASSFGTRAAAQIRTNTSQLRSRSTQVRSARGRSSRAQQLHLNDEAMRGQGYR